METLILNIAAQLGYESQKADLLKERGVIKNWSNSEPAPPIPNPRGTQCIYHVTLDIGDAAFGA